jgi:excisionase family DNA binding protein
MSEPDARPTPEPPLAVTLPEAARLLSISARTAHELVLRGELASVKIGARRVVPRQAILGYLAAHTAPSPRVPYLVIH